MKDFMAYCESLTTDELADHLAALGESILILETVVNSMQMYLEYLRASANRSQAMVPGVELSLEEMFGVS
jgi:hypothetical protein